MNTWVYYIDRILKHKNFIYKSDDRCYLNNDTSNYVPLWVFDTLLTYKKIEYTHSKKRMLNDKSIIVDCYKLTNSAINTLKKYYNNQINTLLTIVDISE